MGELGSLRGGGGRTCGFPMRCCSVMDIVYKPVIHPSRDSEEIVYKAYGPDSGRDAPGKPSYALAPPLAKNTRSSVEEARERLDHR